MMVCGVGFNKVDMWAMIAGDETSALVEKYMVLDDDVFGFVGISGLANVKVNYYDPNSEELQQKVDVIETGAFGTPGAVFFVTIDGEDGYLVVRDVDFDMFGEFYLNEADVNPRTIDIDDLDTYDLNDSQEEEQYKRDIYRLA